MLWRKVEKDLAEFKSAKPKTALLLTGARQVGKTFSVREFAGKHYKDFLEINFIRQPAAKSLFENLQGEEDFFLRLSAFTDKILEPGNTLIFFDEVQECPEVVTYIKFLVDDGRFQYILTGSLLGVELKDLRSAPVGYLREIDMFPLDFEEFTVACGLKAELFEHVKSCWEKREAVNRVVHDKLLELLKLYLVIGGLPAAVQKFLDTRNISAVVAEQRAILREYRKDAGKYDKASKLRIERALDLIPEELNKKNKRFMVSDLRENSRFERLEDNFIWLEEAGIGLATYSATDPKVPLRLSRDSSFFKMYMNDVGLLSAMYSDGIQLRILSGETEINFGSIYENFVAQELRAHGFQLYYFNSRKVGEVDFIVEHGGNVEPIEVKSGKHYKSHAALNNLIGNEDFKIAKALVLSNGNYFKDGKIEYMPIYFAMFLKKDALPEMLTYELKI
ncbi:MAG: ATP-binding protein [Kiritimatiellae bacterium]|nr:ATP-binding protein [Kiritimatiellia bacterium]